jgi:two-component system, cell cycle sensor histidine kinase and response regulator CckA
MIAIGNPVAGQINSKILIVEDMGIVAEDLRLRLRSMGYNVIGTSASGEQAMRKINLDCPDLVLMDIRIQGAMDGIETAEKIRRTYDIPIIFLTGNADNETLRRASVSEAYGFIVKPFNERELQATIEIALHKHSSEREKNEQKQWLTTVLGSIGDAVMTTDLFHYITYLNPAAEALTGWSNEDAVNHEISEVLNLVSEATREAIMSPTRLCIERNEVIWVEESLILISKAGKEIYIEDSAAPLVNYDGRVNGAVLTFRNVTEKRELEARLKQSQKMEAIGRLAGGIAHDFNNLLTVVLGYSDMVLRSIPADDINYERVDVIKQSGERAAKLTAQLLAFGRKQTLKPVVLDLNETVAGMQQILNRLIGEDIEMNITLGKNLGMVKADSSQIEQILLNLVANARDAMPNGGKVTIETNNVFLDENYVAMHPETLPGRYVMLGISDTGEGISPEIQANIFEPFFTTKDVGRGTGLGLATVHGIVKQSGGNIWLYSEKGLGTTLKIYLPLVQDLDAPEITEQNYTASVDKPNTETVLIVEDEEMLRELATEILDFGGFKVLTAAKGDEALEICKNHPGEIHLLLTDVIMPEMNGRDLAERAQVLRPNIKVVYMSGYSNETITHSGIMQEDVPLIEKPFTTNLFLNKVREALK